VLPVLCGDTLVGRLDLKADRATATLRVEAAHLEPGVDAKRVAGRVGANLRDMAPWLSLERVVVGRRGNFATALGKRLGSRR